MDDEHPNIAVRPPWANWAIAHELQLRWVVIAIAVVIFAVQWLRSALLVEDGDFYLHWQFACRFVQHKQLYADGLHIPYPPFWAMAWAPIAALSLPVAKSVCYPLSAVALGVLLWTLNRLTRERIPLSNRGLFWATVAAIALTSRFLVRELPECGPNLMLLTLTWSAIYLWTRQRDVPAGVCLGLATALKCTPAIFIAYFAWKRQWKLAIVGTTAAALFALAPAVWQGPNDYQRHVRLWLTHLSLGAGQTDPTIGVLGPETLQNLSLRPAVARWLMHLPAGHPSRLDQAGYVDFLNLSPLTAGRVAKGVLLALLAIVAWAVRKPVRDRADLAILWECAAVSALALLLSPITWYQHCVVLLPTFYLVSRTAASGRQLPNWIYAVVAAFVVIVMVLNRGLIGRDATMLLASYHLTTWAIASALCLALGGRSMAIEKPPVSMLSVRRAA